MTERLCCPVCGHRLGLYEPIVVRRNGTLGTTSLLRDPRLGRDGEECFHDACYQYVADYEGRRGA